MIPEVPQSTFTTKQQDVLSKAFGSGMPPGAIAPYAGAAAPAGWLLCQGQNVSRTTYARLFLAIGTAFGAGDGSTTFAVPDLRGRVIAGVDAGAGRLTGAYVGGSGGTLAAVGGEQGHDQTYAEMVGHGHNTSGTSGADDRDHSHYISGSTVGRNAAHNHTSNNGYVFRTNILTAATFTPVAGGAAAAAESMNTESADHGHAMGFSSGGYNTAHLHNIAGAADVQGSGNIFNVVQPTIVLNYIIATGL